MSNNLNGIYLSNGAKFFDVYVKLTSIIRYFTYNNYAIAFSYDNKQSVFILKRHCTSHYFFEIFEISDYQLLRPDLANDFPTKATNNYEKEAQKNGRGLKGKTAEGVVGYQS